MNAIELSIFVSRIESICEEMGAVLRRSAFSPNIKDRLDYSCAVFDAQGQLCAQAAHIPVHLGSMAYAMADIVNTRQWFEGDMLVLNNPYLGGTHLPDVTMIAPVFAHSDTASVTESSHPVAFVVNRAHHADIGADTPGSMPLSTSLDEEGVVISPLLLVQGHRMLSQVMDNITCNMSRPDASKGDFLAQISANQTGVARLGDLIQQQGERQFRSALVELNNYGERLAKSTLEKIPDGAYHFEDYLDDDGAGNSDIKIAVSLQVRQHTIDVDFKGTAEQVKGNINCPLSVAAAAVYYVFRCLMPPQTPACAGSFRMITISAPQGCLLNARYPAAVTAGNVETSTRVVDVVLGALVQVKGLEDRIPAASYGTMNNIAMGSRVGEQHWDYYETIGGGLGASMAYNGQSGVQAHMTNTLNTPIESLEHHYPLRVTRYALRENSGGEGRHSGGMGLIRELEFLQETQITLLTERRRYSPWGLAGGAAGQAGENLLDDKLLPGKVLLTAQSGQRLTIKTPGGGGWGEIE